MIKLEGKTPTYNDQYLLSCIEQLKKRIEALEKDVTSLKDVPKQAEESELRKLLKDFSNAVCISDCVDKTIANYSQLFRQLAVRKVDGINVGLNENWYDALQRMKKALEVM